MRRFRRKEFEYRFNNDGSFIGFFNDGKLLEDKRTSAVGKLSDEMIESLKEAGFIEVKEKVK